MVFRAFISVAVLFICSVAVLILYLVAHGDLTAAHAPVVEYKDFVTILLTALAVMISVAAFLGALAAVWGFSVLKDESRVAAKLAAEAMAKARVEAMVPLLVEEAMSFHSKGAATKADEIAEEYGKEVK